MRGALFFCTLSIDPNIVFLCHCFLDVSQDSQLQVKGAQLRLFFFSFQANEGSGSVHVDGKPRMLGTFPLN